jgi:ATP-binding protein involved in chromosome partitioning
MFHQVKVPILGIVENMSYLICPHCQERVDVFSYGGGRRTAQQMQVHFLGELPLNPQIRIGGDSGNPVALGERKQPGGFHELARHTVERIRELGPQSGPRIDIED